MITARLQPLQRIAILFVVIVQLFPLLALGQQPDHHILHRRSTDLLETGSPQKMEAFLDSLRTLAQKDVHWHTAHRLMTARWYRHTNRLHEAFSILDSLKAEVPTSEPYLGYLIHYQIAKTLGELQVYDQAEEAARQAHEKALLAREKTEAMRMQLLACEILLDSERLKEAQTCFDTALYHSRRDAAKEGVCRSLIGLGNVYYYQELDMDALRLYDQAFTEARDGGDKGLVVSALLNIGAALSATAGPDSAIALYRSVLDTMRSDPLGFRYRADILGNMASMYSDIGQDRTAVMLIDSTLSIYSSISDTSGLSYSYLFKATALWNLGQRDAAVDQALRARSHARSLNLKAKATKKAADYLRVSGRTVEALELMTEYSTLADSIARIRFDKGLASAQVRYETAEKERVIQQQVEALRLSNEENSRRSLQRNALIGSTLFAAIIALLLYRSMRNRQRLASKEKELHHQQVDQLLSQQEIKSINAMLEGQEKERERVAKDLHDRIGSMLGSIKHQIGSLVSEVADVKAGQLAQYKKVNSLLDDTAGELRRISHDMAAATLSRFGLDKALKDLRDTLHISGRLSVELSSFGLDQRMERSVELAVYRIIQELVSNVLKHAQARELSISVTRTPGRLSVVVADDGRGFDVSAVHDGMGLTNVRSRAAALGAHVQVDSTPGKGTTVSLECPVVE